MDDPNTQTTSDTTSQVTLTGDGNGALDPPTSTIGEAGSDTPHPPTEAELADMGRPANAGPGEVAGSRDELLSPIDTPLRTDGPTLEEYVAAGYRAENYPPAGYAPRLSTADPRKLPPFNDEDLHPNVLEALKRLDVAEADWQKARESIDGQFLKSLDHLGADFAAQAAAVRARMPA